MHLFFFFLAMPGSMWDISSPPGVKAGFPAVEAPEEGSLNHWNTTEVQHALL